jgi:hypothetical protein
VVGGPGGTSAEAAWWQPAAHVTVEIGGRLIGSVCEPGKAEGSRVCCWDGSDAGQEGVSGSAYSEPSRYLPAA